MANDRKDKKVEVCMTADQKHTIEEAAKSAGVSCSAWLLSLGLKAAKENK
jgi:uncharacterized protein (DUF1778 family)